MRTFIYALSLLFFGMSLTSCASYFKRKECEATNWHQHGYNVAMSGKRLDSDSFIRECQKVEAEISYSAADTGFKEGMGKYCDLDTVYREGKLGKKFNFDMCDGLSRKAMQKRHAEGVIEFCQESNGYTVGASGTVYQNLCPKNLEAKFLAEYRRGRKVYLNNSLVEKERQIADLEQEISNFQDERTRKSYELSALSSVGRTVARERKWDARTNTYKEEVRTIEDESVKRRRDDLQWEMNRISNSISTAEAKKRSVREEMRKIREELITL